MQVSLRQAPGTPRRGPHLTRHSGCCGSETCPRPGIHRAHSLEPPPAPWSLTVTPAWPGPVPKCLRHAQHHRRPGPTLVAPGRTGPWAPEHRVGPGSERVCKAKSVSCQAAFQGPADQALSEEARQSWPPVLSGVPSSDTLSSSLPVLPRPPGHGAAYSWPAWPSPSPWCLWRWDAVPTSLSSLTWQPWDQARPPLLQWVKQGFQTLPQKSLAAGHRRYSYSGRRCPGLWETDTVIF